MSIRYEETMNRIKILRQHYEVQYIEYVNLKKLGDLTPIKSLRKIINIYWKLENFYQEMHFMEEEQIIRDYIKKPT
jgi:hypothetical protein